MNVTNKFKKRLILKSQEIKLSIGKKIEKLEGKFKIIGYKDFSLK